MKRPTPGWFVDIDVTSSGRFMTVSVGDHETSEVWLARPLRLRTRRRASSPRARPFVRYEVEHHGARPRHPDERRRGRGLQDRHDAARAPGARQLARPHPAPARRDDPVPHGPGAAISSGSSARTPSPASSCGRSGPAQEHAIAFAEDAYSLGLSPRPRVRHRRHPLHLLVDDDADRDLRLRLRTRARTLRKRQEVPSGHDPADYVTRRLFATAHDGEQVPISILHRRDVALDGSAPCLLYGYGSYGTSMPAAFRTNRSRSSTAASSTPSPMSAAARRRAGAGTWTASARRSRTPSRTSSPAPRR